MTRITDFTKLDKSEFKALRLDIDKALESLGKEYGLKFTGGNISYTPGDFTIKVTGAIVLEDGSIADGKAALTFTELAEMYGMKKTDLNKRFMFGKQEMRIVGLNQRKHKQPLMLMDNEGKRYCSSVESVKRFIDYVPAGLAVVK